MAWHVAGMGEKRNLCHVSARNPGYKQQVKAPGWEAADLTGLKQGSAPWRALVKPAMNPRSPKVRGISRLAEKQLAFQDIPSNQSVSQSVRDITSNPNITR